MNAKEWALLPPPARRRSRFKKRDYYEAKNRGERRKKAGKAEEAHPRSQTLHLRVVIRVALSISRMRRSATFPSELGLRGPALDQRHTTLSSFKRIFTPFQRYQLVTRLAGYHPFTSPGNFTTVRKGIRVWTHDLFVQFSSPWIDVEWNKEHASEMNGCVRLWATIVELFSRSENTKSPTFPWLVSRRVKPSGSTFRCSRSWGKVARSLPRHERVKSRLQLTRDHEYLRFLRSTNVRGYLFASRDNCDDDESGRGRYLMRDGRARGRGQFIF